jgi:hypothetical protein
VLFLICVIFTIYFMRTNPGGGLAPEEVIGRDALIADLWDKLERHSVMMTAERRMGRTAEYCDITIHYQGFPVWYQ